MKTSIAMRELSQKSQKPNPIHDTEKKETKTTLHNEEPKNKPNPHNEESKTKANRDTEKLKINLIRDKIELIKKVEFLVSSESQTSIFKQVINSFIEAYYDNFNALLPKTKEIENFCLKCSTLIDKYKEKEKSIHNLDLHFFKASVKNSSSSQEYSLLLSFHDDCSPTSDSIFRYWLSALLTNIENINIEDHNKQSMTYINSAKLIKNGVFHPKKQERDSSFDNFPTHIILKCFLCKTSQRETYQNYSDNKSARFFQVGSPQETNIPKMGNSKDIPNSKSCIKPS